MNCVVSFVLLTSFFYVAHAGGYGNQPICRENLTIVSRPIKSYGGDQSFYNIIEGISRSITPSFDADYYSDVAFIYQRARNRSLSLDDITPFAKRYAWPIIFIVLGFIIIIGLPIAGVIFVCARSLEFCGAKREHKYRSKWLLATYLVLLIVVIGFMIHGLAVYFRAMGNAINTLDNLSDPVDDIVRDIRRMLDYGPSTTECNIRRTIGNLFSKVNNSMWMVSNETFAKFEAEYGYDTMKKIRANESDILSLSDTIITDINATTLSINQAIEKLERTGSQNDTVEKLKKINDVLKTISETSINSKKTVHKIIKQVDQTFDQVSRKISESAKSVGKELKKASDQLNSVYDRIEELEKTVNSAVGTVNRTIESAAASIRNIHDEYMEETNKNIITNALYSIVAVPSLIIIIPTLIVILSAAFQLFVRDDLPSQRLGCLSISAGLGMLGVYMAFFVGWIIMLAATGTFVASYGVQFACGPIFHDKNMKLLKDIREFNIVVRIPYGIDKTLRINPGVVLEKCEDNVGILNALGGGELIDVDDILKKTHLEDVRNRAIKAFNEANITYSFPSQIFQELKNASGEMVKSSANFPSTEGLPANPELQEAITNINRTRQNIGKFSKKLEVLVQQISQTINESALSAAFQKDKGIRIIREQFDKIMGRIKNDIIIERDNLLKSAFPCKPLYDLWQKIAAVICVELNTPLQGVWGSAGLIAIFLVPTIALIVPTVKYLFRMKSKYDFHR